MGEVNRVKFVTCSWLAEQERDLGVTRTGKGEEAAREEVAGGREGAEGWLDG